MRSTGHREVVNTYFGAFSFMVILAGGRTRDVWLFKSAVGFESLAEKVRLFSVWKSNKSSENWTAGLRCRYNSISRGEESRESFVAWSRSKPEIPSTVARTERRFRWRYDRNSKGLTLSNPLCFLSRH